MSTPKIPVIKTRLNNPVISGSKFTVDVEFNTDTPQTRVAGGNVRLFYDSTHFTNSVVLKNFEVGYGPHLPNPPKVILMQPAAKQLFNLSGTPIAVNGAFDLVDRNAERIYLPTDGTWKKIFQIELTLVNPVTPPVKPSIILDLEVNPANGGFGIGSAGWVLAALVGDEPIATNVSERVEHLNWKYIGTGAPPYGMPT